MHLLWAKTNWQNVQEEALDGCSAAQELVCAHKTHHTVSVDTLKSYLAHLASRQNTWSTATDEGPANGAILA
ncbi:hypothetical protein [Magnetospirillum moscoviense]|uniref:Uncharacterized protein n=1 Tax=Magnetospirillum moscoviense TaxID=1437059 RepID=A0A178MRT0_9PROT|nr:hypothetical protein [Magnetospirillum moscoviense]MBF0324525.1 hypothetical protein [Alphaproteobacteria bacterium]OAN51548.1 hypothetical protein A6A05_01415 [Magnetospirillum moscoviense]